MGSGGSKKKKQDEQETKKPVWADSITHSIALDSGCDYTGLSVMGLAQLKPHFVGQLIYTAPEEKDAVSQDGGGPDDGDRRSKQDGNMSVDGGTQKSEKTKHADGTTEFSRVPSDKSAKSRWSLVKSQVSHKTGDPKSAAGKSQTPATNLDFGRVPSNASQVRSAASHWSGLKSKFSIGSGGKIEDKVSSYVYVGEFLEGKKQGLGVQTHDDGRVYAGEWLEGEMHGWGTLTRKDGSVYRGKFEKGAMCGIGAEIIMSSEQDSGFQQSDPTRLFLSFEGAWANGRREGRGIAGRVRDAQAASVQGLVRVNIVRYNRGVLIPTDTVPIAESKSKWASLEREQTDAWMHAVLMEIKAERLKTMAEKLLIQRAHEILNEGADEPEGVEGVEGVVEEGVVEEDEGGAVKKKWSEKEVTEEMVKRWEQIKDVQRGESEDEDRKQIKAKWDAAEAAQYDIEMAAQALQKEREEAEERARLLEIQRLEALARLEKAQRNMETARATQTEAMTKMKEAKTLRAKALQKKDEQRLLEMQLMSMKEETVKSGQTLQAQEEREQNARQEFDEAELHVYEAETQMAACEAKCESAERSVKRLTQEYELGRDQLRVQAADCLTFHQVKEVFEKYDADQSGELERDEITLALEDLGLPSSGAAVDRFIQQLDTDCTGTLDWREFQQLARKSEESRGADGILLKDATDTEKEVQMEMNRAIGRMMASKTTLAAAQVKAKSAQMIHKERQTAAEEAAAKLMECQLAEERARTKQETAEIRLESLSFQGVSLEEEAATKTRDAAEAAAMGSLLWEEATLELAAAERGDKVIAAQSQDEAVRQAALAEARKRAIAELEESGQDDSVQVSQATDAARIAWLKDYGAGPPVDESQTASAAGDAPLRRSDSRTVKKFGGSSQFGGSMLKRSNANVVSTTSVLEQTVMQVTIVKAQNLVAKDRGGTSDPFVELKMGTKQFKTKVVKKSLSPEWCETFKFDYSTSSPTLSVVVYDQDKNILMGTSAEYMGSVEINLEEVALDGNSKNTAWYDLVFDGQYQKAVEAITGRVLLTIHRHTDNALERASSLLREEEQEKVNGVDYVYPDRKAKYCGEWREGMRWGQGKLTLYSSTLPKNSTVLFAGEQIATEPGGLCVGEKAVYEGLWVRDMPDGLGVMLDPLHGRYQGAWKRGVRQGNGLFRDANGNTYQGRWKDNSRDGQGIETLANGEKFEGEFQNSLRHGKGVTIQGDTFRHSGQWRRGKMHGKGTLEDDGMTYNGDFRNGERTGKAHVQYGELLEYKGELKNGQRQGNGVMLFEDDRRYNGEWENDEMQGYGVLTYVNGDEYNGPFENGKRHGPKGSMEMNELEGCSATYIGDFYCDRMEGRGVTKWVDGRKYEGQFQDGIRFGQGVMTYSDGTTYDGNWTDSVRSGMGALTFADGGKYEGLFQNDVRHGRGTMEFSNGEKCSGEWQGDRMHGKGVFTYADGSTYEGEFVDGLICGRGEYHHENGRQYIGNWEDGMREGRGEEIDENGRTYSGFFHRDLKHGNGVWKWPNGHVYDGMWLEGKQHGWGKERIPADIYGSTWTEYEGEYRLGHEKMGKGRFTSANGEIYDGQWTDKMKHGFGRLVAADGYSYEGEWMQDQKNGIGKENTTSGDSFQGEFHNGARHGRGTEINARGDQYIGEYFKGVRSGEGKAFKNATFSRYEGEFIGDLQHGFGTCIQRQVVDGERTWITYEGEWREGAKHGEGTEFDPRSHDGCKVQYFVGQKTPVEAESIFYRTPSLTLSETSKSERDAIHEILRSLEASISSPAEREEWIWRLETGLSDSNEKCSTFRQQILEHQGVAILCQLLRNDTDDMAQLKGGQLLFFMTRSVDFSGMARAVLECQGAVASIVALLHEENSEPRVYACGILEALCKDKDFAREAVCGGAATKLVSLLRNLGWITIKGKGSAARALKNIGHHQRAVVAVELGLPVASGGRGFDSEMNDIERHNVEEAIRKILIATGAGEAAVTLGA